MAQADLTVVACRVGAMTYSGPHLGRHDRAR